MKTRCSQTLKKKKKFWPFLWVTLFSWSLPCSCCLQPHRLQFARFLCPWHFPGKNTGVSCHFFLQGIFLTLESNPGLLHCRQILYPLSYTGSPRNMGKYQRISDPHLTLTLYAAPSNKLPLLPPPNVYPNFLFWNVQGQGTTQNINTRCPLWP